MANTVLLLDPDPRLMAEALSTLEQQGWITRLEREPGPAAAALAGQSFDLVIAEARVFGELLPQSSPAGSSKWILLDTFALLHGGVGALRRGAFEVLPRPVPKELLVLAAERALATLTIERELASLRQRSQEQHLGPLSTRSPRLGQLFALCRRVAPSQASLLITGESGTGKSELARAVHGLSKRAAGPFVEVHCGALAGTLLETELFGHAAGAFTGARGARAGKFEAADGGSLFLDELATASLDLQIKLLRVLETGRLERVGETETRVVDVRLIAATNGDLASEVAAGRFREDLYWRIQVLTLELPSLRERPEDVELLAEKFLALAVERQGRGPLRIEPAAMDQLRRHPWPGNVRELRQTMERASLLALGPSLSASELLTWWNPGAAALARRSPRPLNPRDVDGGSDYKPRESGPLEQPSASGQPGSANPAPGSAGSADLGRADRQPSAAADDRNQSWAAASPAADPVSHRTLDQVPLGPLAGMLEGPERSFLIRALQACSGSRQEAARLLGINRSTLFNKMRKHGLLEAPKRSTPAAGGTFSSGRPDPQDERPAA